MKGSYIGAFTNVPITSIHNILRSRDQVQGAKRGRPSKLDRVQRRNLIRHVRIHQFDSAEMIRSSLQLPISNRTVCRELKKVNFQSSIMKKKDLLTAAHKRKRVKFARDHAHFGDRWNTVVFTDEKKFNLVGNDGYYRVWVEGDEEVVLERDSNVKLSVMVWGAIAYGNKLQLVCVDHRMNAEKYIEMLDDYVIHVIQAEMGEDAIFLCHFLNCDLNCIYEYI